jgi:hypothetical protein
MTVQQLYENAIEAKNSGNEKVALKSLTKIINDYPDSKEAELARAMRYKITHKEKTAAASTSTSTAPYTSDYGTARGIAQVISVIGWIVVAVGSLAAIAGLSGSNQFGGVSLLAVLPGLGIAVSGLLLVVAGQVTRATVDNADHTREILKLLKERS